MSVVLTVLRRARRPCSLRLLSASADAPAKEGSETGEAQPKKKKKKLGHNLFEVLDQLPKGGKGMKLTRTPWLKYEEPSFWTLNRIKFSKVFYIVAMAVAERVLVQHGHTPKAWGVHTWRGTKQPSLFATFSMLMLFASIGRAEDKAREVHSTHKREWMLLDEALVRKQLKKGRSKKSAEQ